MSTHRQVGSEGAEISRCTVPRATAMSWFDFVDDSHPSAVALVEWIQGLAPFARTYVLGQIDALLETAAEGGIVDDGEVRLLPIRSDPDLYELRWTLLSKKVRQYHAEPPHQTELLVKLHHHIKALSKEKAITTQAQDSEIDHAQDRYRKPAPTQVAD